VQSAAGQAEAILGGARAYLIHTVGEAFAAVETCVADSQAPDPGPAVARARLAITHAMHEAVRCVDILFHAAGTLSVYKRNVIERCFRDVHVARQHAAALPAHFQTAGKSTLGLTIHEAGW
jgi:alkylation response protein AidB-like acyl-CoA dehydrogenase